MTHALVTIIAPLPRPSLTTAASRIDQLGNPPRDDIKAALDVLESGDGTHFCSLHAVPSKDLGKAYLAFEFSADGPEEQAIGRIARAIGNELRTVFELASDWKPRTDIGDYLVAHRIKIGVGLFDSPGLAFAGAPGMSVGRILAEQRLALKATELVSAQPGDMWALQRVQAVRDKLRNDPEVSDMLETGTAAPPFAPLGTVALIGRLALSFLATYLWPVGIILLLAGLIGALRSGGAFIEGFLEWLIAGVVVALVVVAVAALLGYGELRSLEERDSLEERSADPETLAAIFQRENHYTQNHMISVTQRKPGVVRWFTARLIFWIIGQLATYQYRPGFLSDIGTIHFARWVTVPNTRDVVFLSNYDSSWESYLEDFITKAHDGLTGVWSNSIGFPRSENLVQKGATDGERFKRYARQSMIPTRFWYCAYPTLTTGAIRTNAAIRLGLSGALTEDEAMNWLALFGSAPRPASKLINNEIQSIIFGGLGFMKCGTCLLVDLPENLAEARAWLADIMPNVAFNDGRRLKQNAVVTLALGPDGLRRLGLPDEGLRTFPYAFLSGQTSEARARILGDTGDNAAEHWRWGKTPPNVALLVYGKSPADVAQLEATLITVANNRGVRLVHTVPLQEITDDKREPFGFADGISQPVIRGTYKGLKGANSTHLVEAGEFILGYPDNRGNRPPGPTLPATADPRNILPLVESADDFTRNFVDGVRDLGCNGSFLVIRELEQDVGAFDKYCRQEADRLRDRLPEPYEITAQFIGAKLIGRWQNGSSIIRHAYLPKTRHKHEAPHSLPQAAVAYPITEPATPAAATAQVQRRARPRRMQDNDFLFGTEDPEALRCPFGAHIRRANPRDSLSPGSQDQIDISNRHRIIRIGRQYVPSRGGRPGLFFMCLNGDLERQFEFVQQTWLNNPSFHGLSGEKDPLLGDAEPGMCGFTIPSRYGPVRLSQVPAMVATRGGGYFFLPGKRLLDFLAVPP